MNVLVLGQGGREHALIRALGQSSLIETVFALPGRVGFESLAENLSNHVLEKESVKILVKENDIGLVVVGPEKELAEGWSDFFRSLGVLVFGPSKESAQLESSKIFAKHFMLSSGIPTCNFKIVHSVKESLQAASSFSFPLVLKADGLASGKGVFICKDEKELRESASLLFEKKSLGDAGKRALVEPFQEGWELSAFILTDGKKYETLPFVRDYKRLKEGNSGPNTGGMGAFAPYLISSDLFRQIDEQVIQPSIRGIQKNHFLYQGVLYIGLMISKKGPLVLEYNVRFGDPEAQVLLPLLDGDWGKVFACTARGHLPSLQWKKNIFVTCVVLASEGYPLQPVKGSYIKGSIDFSSSHSYFLHAGSEKSDASWITNGGRVLNAIGMGDTKEESIKRAYQQSRLVGWRGCQLRSDIGS